MILAILSVDFTYHQIYNISMKKEKKKRSRDPERTRSEILGVAAREIYDIDYNCYNDLNEMYKVYPVQFCDGGKKNNGDWDGPFDCWHIRVNSEGVPYVEPLKDWESNLAVETRASNIHIRQETQSLVGNADTKDKNWTQYRWLSCRRDHAFRLYCFEQ